MTEPTVIPRALTLAREASRLGRDEFVRLSQITWALRSEIRKTPSDLLVRWALADALLRAGESEEAQEHLAAAFTLRHGAPINWQAKLLGTLVDGGLLSQAQTLARDLMERPGSTVIPLLIRNLTNLAMRSGALDLLERCANLAPVEEVRWARDVVRVLNEQNLVDCFSQHQHAIEVVVGHHTTLFTSEVLFDVAGQARILVVRHTDCDPEALPELREQMFTILEQIHREHCHEPCRWIGVLDTVLRGPLIGEAPEDVVAA